MTLDAPKSDAEYLAMLERKRSPVSLGPNSPLRTAPRRRASAKAEGVTEHDIQVALIAWADANTGKYPELATLHATPNGGNRSPRTAGRMKAEGVKPGVPDLHLPVPRGRYHSLWIELKKPGGATSPAQADWLYALATHGHRVALHTHWEAARDEILDYLALPTP